MRIFIKSANNKIINIFLPSSLIFNNITAAIGAKIINKYVSADENYSIRTKDMCIIIRELNCFKKKYPTLNIVDIESSDGNIVKIIL